KGRGGEISEECRSNSGTGSHVPCRGADYRVTCCGIQPSSIIFVYENKRKVLDVDILTFAMVNASLVLCISDLPGASKATCTPNTLHKLLYHDYFWGGNSFQHQLRNSIARLHLEILITVV